MRCVAIFMDRYTFRGGTNVPHEPGTAAAQARPALPGAAAPAPCHVLGPKHFLPYVHNLHE
jgi:hypothetical protein